MADWCGVVLQLCRGRRGSVVGARIGTAIFLRIGYRGTGYPLLQ